MKEKSEDQIIRTEYSEVMQKSYIDYAMSVIISRALPDVRDGLKPVQRRTHQTICLQWFQKFPESRHPVRQAVPKVRAYRRRYDG